MKTIITLEVEHFKPIPALWDLVAGRAYTIDGVSNVTVVVEVEVPKNSEPQRLAVVSLGLELSKLSPEQLAALRVLAG